jgi:murein DD-endopeptidase MepM/ murein hydrolase activator NlpD
VVLLLLVALLAVQSLNGLVWSQTASPDIQDLKQQRRNIEERARYIRKKKNENQRMADYLRNTIYSNQRRKEEAEDQLVANQNRLVTAKSRYGYLSEKLDRTLGEKSRLEKDAADRLRNIYMGERVSMLQMIFDAKDIQTLQDRIYYKKKIVSQDKSMLVALKQKTVEIKAQQVAVENQKREIVGTIGRIESYTEQVKERIAADRVLQDKYRNDARYYAQAESELLSESARIRNSIMALIRRAQSSAQTIVNSTGSFAMPIYGAITSGFGYRRHPIHGVRKMHTGLDISGPNRGAVRAADGGQVLYVGWRGGYGKVVMINHGNRDGVNLVTLYGHLSGYAVGNGQTVSKGQIIGYEGSTGYSTGPHVHFEIRENGNPVNPYKYLR